MLHPGRDHPRTRRSRLPAGSAALWVLAAGLPLAFLALFFVWPVATLVARGFVADGALDLGGFADVFSRPRTWRILGLTLAQAGVATALAVLLGIPGAYVLFRCRFPGRGALRAFVSVPFVLPTVVVGVAFRAVLAEGGPLGALHLDGTFAAIVAALVFFNYTVVVRTVGGLWEHLDPRAEQAARALGASPVRAFVEVTLPALGPAIASAASLVFLFCSTAFGTVLVLGGLRYGTIETEIWVQTTQFLDLRAASVLSVVQLVVVAGALTLAARARRRQERALHLTATAGAAHPLRLGRGHGVDTAAAAVTALVLVGLALPLVTLVVRSLRTPTGWGFGNYVALGTTGGGAGGGSALSVTVWDAALTSLRTATDATVIALVVGGLVALVVSRRPRARTARRTVSVLDALFMLPLGVSAVTVGFGFLLTLDRPLGLPVDLRTSGLLVPIAQAVVAVPLVVRTVLPVLRAIDPRLREAAATLGAGPGRVLRAVDLPIAARALGLAVGFAFAVSLGEFGATSFLARPDRPTLPVVVYRLIGRPGEQNYGMALAASVLLALLTAGIMALAERLRGSVRGGEL
ncbi:ABC transporter permease [Cellulomonas cellasea]|uniref:Iron ABC transporter permease n=2 Tax=Cellulomonas cellasea TaxID=43670 RepID=A0A0A0B2U0_9CELL|nr:iron ABC transporter permease [Cellulomonas cellasea]KGM00462.1 iron ABC transporter permease [Cellulomonas cellasea DSM 20118]GEA86830.1 iron ABC transporter permease [Cellulomonas cellasea]